MKQYQVVVRKVYAKTGLKMFADSVIVFMYETAPNWDTAVNQALNNAKQQFVAGQTLERVELVDSIYNGEIQ